MFTIDFNKMFKTCCALVTICLFFTASAFAVDVHVQAGAAPGGDGSLQAPYDALADVEALDGDPDPIPKTIIVLPPVTPGEALDGGILLKDGQKIQGSGLVQRVNDPCQNLEEGEICGLENSFIELGERSLITNTSSNYDGIGVVLAKDNVVQGLHITGTKGPAIANRPPMVGDDGYLFGFYPYPIHGSQDLGSIVIKENVITGCRTNPSFSAPNPWEAWGNDGWDWYWFVERVPEDALQHFVQPIQGKDNAIISLKFDADLANIQNVVIQNNVLRPSDEGVLNQGNQIYLGARHAKVNALIKNNFINVPDNIVIPIPIPYFPWVYPIDELSPSNIAVYSRGPSDMVVDLVKNVSINLNVPERNQYEISLLTDTSVVIGDASPKLSVNVRFHHSKLNAEGLDESNLHLPWGELKNVAGILVLDENSPYSLPGFFAGSRPASKPGPEINLMVEKSIFEGGISMAVLLPFGDNDTIDFGGGPLGSHGLNTIFGQTPFTDGVLQLNNQTFYGDKPEVWAINNDWEEGISPSIVIATRWINDDGFIVDNWSSAFRVPVVKIFPDIELQQKNGRDLSGGTYLGTVAKDDQKVESTIRPRLEAGRKNWDDYAKHDINLYHFEYDTVRMYDVLNNDSNPVSGTIENRAFLSIPDLPNNSDEPLPIIIYFPFARYERVYEELETEILRSSILSASGFIVLVHYPVGASTSIDLDLHPFEMREGYGTSAKDMLVAAKQILTENGINYSNELFISGYSAGGYGALSAAKMFQEFDVPIPVTAVAPLAGPYNTKLEKDYFLEDKPISLFDINLYIKVLLSLAFNYEDVASPNELDITPTTDASTFASKLEKNAKALFLDDPVNPDRQFASAIIDAYLFGDKDVLGHLFTYFGEMFLKLPIEEQNLATILNPDFRTALESLGENHPLITAIFDQRLPETNTLWQLNSPTRLIQGAADKANGFDSGNASDYFRKQAGVGNANVDVLSVRGSHSSAIELSLAEAVDFFRNPVIVQQVPAPPRVAGATRVAVIGDFGYVHYGDYGFPALKGTFAHLTADLVKSWDPDLIITVGDNNYGDGSAEADNGNPDTIDHNIGQLYNEYIYPYVGEYAPCAEPNPDPNKCPGTNRFFPAVGNADYWEGPGAVPAEGTLDPYTDYFDLPGNERYYDFGEGPVHFFALNTDIREPDGIDENSIQAEWLRLALEDCALNHDGQNGNPNHSWRIVYMHHVPYVASVWLPYLFEDKTLRWPFADWGASVVLSGHIHNYQRLVGEDDLTYMIVGFAGGDIGCPDPKAQSDGTLMAWYCSLPGGTLIDATDTEIIFKTMNMYGEVVDTYMLPEQP